VLTDIGLPFMDGLELTRELARDYPQEKVILTGYDDFEFAQQAVKLQAVDYILKPITSAELGDVMRKLRDELDAASFSSTFSFIELYNTSFARRMPKAREAVF